jgi:hypothetical protein
MVQYIQVSAFSRPLKKHGADIVIRKFLTIIVTLNLVGLILAIKDLWQYPWGYSSPLCLGNLLVAILVRNELFGRVVYLFVNKLFAKVRRGILTLISQISHVLTIQWTPLRFRLACTSTLQHLGGIHSGCAISGLAWLVFHLTVMFRHRKSNSGAVLFIGAVTSIVLAICIGAALPWIRNTHHK